MLALLIGLASAPWRTTYARPVSVAPGRAGLSVTALIVAAVPFAAIFASGRFDLPTTSVAESLSTLAPSSAGGYRVLWLGDPSVLPLAGWSVAPGLAAATSMNDCPVGPRSSRRPTRAPATSSWTRSSRR